MANNFNSGYDPLVANGILPMPVDYMVKNNILPVNSLPIRSAMNNPSSDSYNSTRVTSKGIPLWKKCLFAAVLTTLTFFGLKKLGFKPLKKISEHINTGGIKKFFTDKFTKVRNFVKNIFKKKS